MYVVLSSSRMCVIYAVLARTAGYDESEYLNENDIWGSF
jgi:hypothetical protein